MHDKVRSVPVALDLTRYELTRSGRRVSIERIPMELLILLARSGGRLLTRAEIIDYLWGRNPWLDADRNLNTAIGKIRRALGDDPGKPRYIETAVGKGYRFIATVHIGEAPGGFTGNGHAELVILDSPSPPSTPAANAKPEIEVAEIPDIPHPADTPAPSRQGPRKIVLYSSGVAAGILLLSVSVYAWKVLDGWGWTFHDRDTSVWIRGDWLVGEYRNCELKAEPAQQANAFNSPSALPGLYCGEGADGLLEFQGGSPPALAESPSASRQPAGVSIPDRQRGFHIMPVRYFGKSDRSDKPLTAWRCRRNSDSLTCKAPD